MATNKKLDTLCGIVFNRIMHHPKITAKQLRYVQTKLSNDIQQLILAQEIKDAKVKATKTTQTKSKEEFKKEVRANWARANLVVGDLYRLTPTGCVRKVINLTPSENGICNELMKAIPKTFPVEYKSSNISLVESWEAVVKIYRNGQWVDVYTLASGNIKE